MSEFVWLGNIDTDIANPKNWFNASTNAAALRSPGQNPDGNDNIWFVKTTGNKQVTGALTNGINNCYILATTESSVAIANLSGQNGIDGQWTFYADLNANNLYAGYVISSGAGTNYNGFAADRFTFKNISNVTIATSANLNSGTYEGTLTAATLNIGNSAVDSFIGTSGHFKVSAGGADRVITPYQTKEILKLTINSAPQTVKINNTTTPKLTASTLVTAAGVTGFAGNLPITSTGTITQNGGEIIKASNLALTTADDFIITANQTYETIIASPSISTISTLTCNRFVIQGTLGMGGVLSVAASYAHNATHGGVPDIVPYTAYISGAITNIHNASSGLVISSNTDTSKFINCYFKSTTDTYKGLGVGANVGTIDIYTDDNSTMLGPFLMSVTKNQWVGNITFENRHALSGAFTLRKDSGITETGLTLKYTGADKVVVGALVDDIDTPTPITFDWNNTNTTYNFTASASGVTYKFVDLTFKQLGKVTMNASEIVEVSGNLTITGGTFNSDETFKLDKNGTATLLCTAETELAPTIIIGVAGTATTCEYNWNATATEYPILNITANSILKPVAATTGANSLTGVGTFNWSGGITTSNMLFYITKSTGTPIANGLTISNANHTSGYRTIFRYDVRVSSSYSITLPNSVSGDIELGSDGSPSLTGNNDPIYNCPSACVITGNLTIDFSGYTKASTTYNAKVMVASASNELQVTGDVVINAKGYCAAKIKVTNGNFTNTGVLASSKLSLISNTAGTYSARCGTNCTVSDMLIDGQGLTSVHKLNGNPTLTGTYTITDATISLADGAITTAQSIAITGAASCTPNKHLFVLVGGGTINDASTETTSVAGLSFVGCNSLGAIQLSAGNTGLVGSIVADSLILKDGSITQQSTDAKKLWLRGGTHPTALLNTQPGYKQGLNFSNIAINAEVGHFEFPCPANNSSFNVADTLIIGDNNDAEIHFYKDGSMTLGASHGTNSKTQTIVKWNTTKGINFGPNSGWSGTFRIDKCDIEGHVNMHRPLVNTDSTNLISTVKTILIHKNNIHSTDKSMAIINVDEGENIALQMSYNIFSAGIAQGILTYTTRSSANIVPATSLIQYNHIRSTGTNGTMVYLGCPWSHREFFSYNTLSTDTMTSGKGLILGDTSTVLNQNTILVTDAVIPIDLTGGINQQDIMLTGWYFDTANANFGKSCRGSLTKSLTSQFTNEQVNNKYLIAGIRESGAQSLIQYEDYSKWEQTSGADPLVTAVSNNKTYRFARNQAKVVQTKYFYIADTDLTISWSEYDSSNPIAVVAKVWDGATETNAGISSGGTLSLAGKLRVRFQITMASNEGFADFKIVDNKGRIIFTDDLSTGHGTQSAARHEVGPLSGIGYGGKNTSSAIVPHVTSQYNDPINQVVKLYVRPSIINNGVETKWVVLLGEQDSNDFYRLTVHQQASGTNNDILLIEKSVSGTVTQLATATNANFTAGDANTDVIISAAWDEAGDKLNLSISGTTTSAWSYSIQASDAVFSTGYWGFAVDSGDSTSSVLKAEVYDGKTNSEMFLNGADLIFMPESSWKFPSTITNVEFRNVTINGDQSLLPNLYGTHTTVVNSVTFVDTALPSTITNLLVIKNSTLTVSGDITISGNGKLFLTGCNVKSSARWKFKVSGVSYTDSPPLEIKGTMLQGMHTTMTPENESQLVVDDTTKGTSVVRVQSMKDMNITRNAILGLNYERMVFNGYDSKTLILTIQSVNDASIIGKFEEMFLTQKLFAITTSYCYLWKAKVVSFVPRYLNMQANALQAIVTVEEWRDD